MEKLNRKIMTVTGIFALSILLYFIIHYIATLQRGYEAIGGEILALQIPVLIYVMYWEYKDRIKRRKEFEKMKRVKRNLREKR